MVVAQELGEVVEEHEEDAQRAAVEHAHGRRELGRGEEGLEEAEEADEQPLHERPALVSIRVRVRVRARVRVRVWVSLP